jgi:hypothetical protein
MVSSVITITGLGDHDRPEWPITMAGMRNNALARMREALAGANEPSASAV